MEEGSAEDDLERGREWGEGGSGARVGVGRGVAGALKVRSVLYLRHIPLRCIKGHAQAMS